MYFQYRAIHNLSYHRQQHQRNSKHETKSYYSYLAMAPANAGVNVRIGESLFSSANLSFRCSYTDIYSTVFGADMIIPIRVPAHRPMTPRSARTFEMTCLRVIDCFPAPIACAFCNLTLITVIGLSDKVEIILPTVLATIWRTNECCFMAINASQLAVPSPRQDPSMQQSVDMSMMNEILR